MTTTTTTNLTNELDWAELLTIAELVAQTDANQPGFTAALAVMLREQNAMRADEPVNHDQIVRATEVFPFLDDMFEELCDHAAELHEIRCEG